jgi:5-methylcytosine-specific restriction endonuclease McrA
MARLKMIKPRLATVDTRTCKPPAKRGAPLYDRPEWRDLVRSLKRTRGRRCEACGATDGVIYGDHIKEVRDGGAELDPANVQLLCPSCHGRKTSAARARRAYERLG